MHAGYTLLPSILCHLCAGYSLLPSIACLLHAGYCLLPFTSSSLLRIPHSLMSHSEFSLIYHSLATLLIALTSSYALLDNQRTTIDPCLYSSAFQLFQKHGTVHSATLKAIQVSSWLQLS